MSLQNCFLIEILSDFVEILSDFVEISFYRVLLVIFHIYLNFRRLLKMIYKSRYLDLALIIISFYSVYFIATELEFYDKYKKEAKEIISSIEIL